MAEQLLNLEQVSKYYTGNQSVVVGLNSVTLSLERGEFVAVTGESGSGKSTLSHVIGGILPYESGELYFKGKETSHYDSLDWERYRRDNISFISQNYGILPGATVMKNVVSALILTGMDKSEAKTAAEKILRQVELWELRRRRAAKLSSGQKQRLSIARALAKPAPILIADEPTGNLDPENSAKVISLLAQAAKDRLVILITHEFDEAKDLATRHIVLQDGRVASDTVLRPANEPEPAPTAAKGKKRVLSPYVARLQSSSRPIWTALMVLFFAMTAFAVFAFLGVFIISLDDTSTRIYDDSAFLNGSTVRIAVMRGDANRFTDEDFEAILAVPHVTALEKNGYVTDAQYAYREDIDYVANYAAVEKQNGMTQVHYIQVTYQMDKDSPFIQTIPLLRDGVTFLTDGRLPENFYEVVSADPNLKVGDTVMLFLSDRKNWNVGDKIRGDFTVVGTTDFGSGLYFHEDVGFMIREGAIPNDVREFFYIPDDDLDDKSFLGNSLTFPDRDNGGTYYEGGMTDDVWIKYRDEINAIERRLSKSNPSEVFTYTDEDGVEYSITIRKDFGETAYFYPVEYQTAGEDGDEPAESFGTVTLKLNKVGFIDKNNDPEEGGRQITNYEPRKLSHVSYTNFCRLTDTFESDQISITIDRYSYTDRVITTLNKLGYTAVSPYQLGSTEQDPELAAERTQTLRVCLIALIAVIALQTVLLRAMFGMQTESYRLLSNIGLTGSVAKLSVVWQVLAFTVAGQLIGGLGIWICAQAGIERIAEILSYLPLIYVLVLSGVHFATSAISTVWIVAALGRQVYPLAGKFEDIVLDDGERGNEQ